MTEKSMSSDHITLGAAAKHAPGRPSANAMWRWCRRGVLARTGERVRLQHVRAGGKIYTTAAWVEDFCSRLADADRGYFDAKDAAARSLPPRSPRFGPPSKGRGRSKAPARWKNADEDTRIDRELEEEGL